MIDNIKNFVIKNRIAVALVTILVVIIIAACYIFTSHKSEGKYDNLSTDAQVYSSDVDEGTASKIAEKAAAVYQYQWNMIVNGRFDDDLSKIPGVDPDFALVSYFPAMRTTSNVIDYEGVFVGPTDIIHDIYVENGDNGSYNAFVCESQETSDVRRISVAGNANSIEGTNGWKIIVKDNNGTMKVQGAVEDNRMCGYGDKNGEGK